MPPKPVEPENRVNRKTMPPKTVTPDEVEKRSNSSYSAIETKFVGGV